MTSREPLDDPLHSETWGVAAQITDSIGRASPRLPGGVPDALSAGITTAVRNRISSHRAVRGSHWVSQIRF